jgi:hypothetical protein
MSKPDDYLWDRSGPADPDVQRLEQLLAPLAHDRPLDEMKLRRKRSRVPWLIGGAVVIAAAAGLVLYLRTSSRGACEGDAGFAFTAKGGTVGCANEQLARGVLPIGGVLDTGAATAELAIADIGTAELAANTRIRLDRNDANQRQQIHLERGRMHARVIAPPRIFAVTTPSTGVTDLGCEYTIEIDAEGKGFIEVQSGKVELETTAHAMIVAPAGTLTRMRENRAPSLPIVIGASSALRSAADEWGRGTPDALPKVLGAAGIGDGITLANLAVLVADPDRERVLNRLAELSPPPEGVTVHGALADPAVFERWRESVVADQIVRSLEDAAAPKK